MRVELQSYEDYLSNRIQFVTYNNLETTREKNPESSILGTIQFWLYQIEKRCFEKVLICLLLAKILIMPSE